MQGASQSNESNVRPSSTDSTRILIRKLEWQTPMLTYVLSWQECFSNHDDIERGRKILRMQLLFVVTATFLIINVIHFNIRKELKIPGHYPNGFMQG